ncbi:MAG: hypothetical protein GKS06_02785 [Acidobacteria bacterium]|nr:hypothetical protein [Acidobacteriota bacterium]
MRTKVPAALVLGTAVLCWLATATVGARDYSDLTEIEPESLPSETPAAAWLPAAETAVRDFPMSAGRAARLATLQMRHLRETADEAVLDDVERLLRRSVELQPGDASLELQLAGALNAQHPFADAIAIAENTDAGDSSAGPGVVLFDAYVGIGRYGDAIAVLETLEGNDDPAVLARRGQMAELVGDDDIAFGLLVRAARQARNSYQSRQHVAWYLYRLGEFNRVRDQLELAGEFVDAALRLAPESLPAAVARARIARVTDAPARALQRWAEIAERMPHPEILAELGDLYDAAGQPDRAKEAWAEALRVGAEAGAAEDRPMARLLADRGWNPDEALMRARRDLTHRQDIEAWDTLAWAAYRAGELEEAAAASEKALSLGTRRADFLEHAALIEEAIADKATP